MKKYWKAKTKKIWKQFWEFFYQVFVNILRILPIWRILFLFLFVSFGTNKLFLFLFVQKLAPQIYSYSYLLGGKKLFAEHWNIQTPKGLVVVKWCTKEDFKKINFVIRLTFIAVLPTGVRGKYLYLVVSEKLLNRSITLVSLSLRNIFSAFNFFLFFELYFQSPSIDKVSHFLINLRP